MKSLNDKRAANREKYRKFGRDYYYRYLEKNKKRALEYRKRNLESRREAERISHWKARHGENWQEMRNLREFIKEASNVKKTI
jgi:hypothetical protein